MFSRSSWLHVRIPFSYFLLPIFLFSVAISPNFNGPRLAWTFLILHFLLYPASNGYNSYFDRDEKSIGGLKHPPPVSKGLYFLALSMDALAVILGYIFINSTFALMLLVYGLVSKAYSHPSIRLKRYAITGWLVTGLFQGLFTFVMCYVGINDFGIETALSTRVIFPGILTSLMLWANYPLTQVYQHEEDSRRGDRTLSLMLGVNGTFYFSAVFFTVSASAFFMYLKIEFALGYALFFLASLAPVLVFFLYWLFRVGRDQSRANYQNAMALSLISSTCLNAYFIFLFLDSSQVAQVIKAGF